MHFVGLGSAALAAIVSLPGSGGPNDPNGTTNRTHTNKTKNSGRGVMHATGVTQTTGFVCFIADCGEPYQDGAA